MLTGSDRKKLLQIMDTYPDTKEFLAKLLDDRQAEISILCHELRNPLTIISSTLQLMETQNPDLMNIRHWDSLRQDVSYMSQLLEAFSSYNHSLELRRSIVDPEPFLKSCCLAFAASIADTPIDFSSKIEASLPTVYMDRIKIQQVLLNLLGNAKDAATSETSEKTCKPVIFLHAFVQDTAFHRSAEKSLVISVEDNGSGIPEENLSTIFEPFVTYKPNGTGLGLALSKNIAEAHGGSLTVSSAKLKSTVFSLSIPIYEQRT